MYTNGFSLIELLVGIICTSLFAVVVSQGTRILNQNRIVFNENIELKTSLVAASSTFIQIGRLADYCEKQDTDLDGSPELFCKINREGVTEEIRFAIDSEKLNLLLQTKQGSNWVTQTRFPKIAKLVLCDQGDIKLHSTDPTGNHCNIQDRNLSDIYARSHEDIESQFFRFQIVAAPLALVKPGPPLQQVQGSFFLRNSVSYPNISRYVWGWSDSVPAN